MDPEKMMTGISNEILTSIRDMGKAKTPEDKLAHSKTIKIYANHWKYSLT